MKTTLLICITLLTSVLCFAQEEKTSTKPANGPKLGLSFGGGVGLKKIDFIEFDEYDEDGQYVSSGVATISGGGGVDFELIGEYVIHNAISLSAGLGVQHSFLSDELEDASVGFTRFSIRPTVKYLVPVGKAGNSTLNFGGGYGFYTGAKMKAELDGFKDENKYNSASGAHLLAEYEYTGPIGFGMTLGMKYVGVKYQSTERLPEPDFDQLNGNYIGFYMGLNYRFKQKAKSKVNE